MGRSGAIFLLVLACSACDCGEGTPEDRRVVFVADPGPPMVPPDPPHTRQAAERAMSWLMNQVREPAGDPENPWALAHGLLAFGKDFKARDGRSAVDVIASFAERRAGERGGPDRYGFVPEHDGKPIEPHSHLFVKTFLEIGLDPSLELRTADGTTIDIRRLLTDMRASVSEPQDDTQWHDSAWWLSALELDPVQDAAALARLREAALSRLEIDDSVIVSSQSDAFAADAPMGLAKRNKTHIYGHPCGGFHFMQAVLRGAKGNASPDFIARVERLVRQLVLTRYRAERSLYQNILRTHPSATLMISAQQLKFFGHLLETLAVVEEVGLVRNGGTFAFDVQSTRRSATGDLIETITQLENAKAYGRLSELSVQQHQLFLDLIGDGCHAIHGLRETLVVLPNP
jgi:hypothetical protein